MVLAAVGAAALTLLALLISEPIGGLLFAAGYGATTRGEGALVVMLLASYYGRRSFGAISGFVTGLSLIGLGAGPLLFSVLYETTDSYTKFFLMATAILSVSAVMLWAAKRPAGAMQSHS